MLKTLSSLMIAIFGLSANLALAEYVQFSTPEEEAQHCPALNALTFTPLNPSTANSKGTITGAQNSVHFKNTGDYALSPLAMDENNIIENVQPRSVVESDGSYSYGYISNNVISCFYSYPGFTGVSVGVILQSTSSH